MNEWPGFIYLLELRTKLIQTLGIFSLFFLFFFYKAPTLYHAMVTPLLHVLPAHSEIIATSITASFMIPLHLAMDAALLCTTPFALIQLWRFASPGLYRQEQHLICWGICLSIVLFIIGGLFCFYILLPLLLHFFVQALPLGVRMMPDLQYTIDFITRMLLILGLCFQIPLLCALLVRLNLCSSKTLTEYRPYIIVAAFIIGMLVTPPDVLSQITVAIPLCFLYEVGILFARYCKPRKPSR